MPSTASFVMSPCLCDTVKLLSSKRSSEASAPQSDTLIESVVRLKTTLGGGLELSFCVELRESSERGRFDDAARGHLRSVTNAIGEVAEALQLVSRLLSCGRVALNGRRAGRKRV